MSPISYRMTFPRERDCYVLYKGDSYGVSLSSDMVRDGWQGGQAVQWADSQRDEFLVTFSDGLYGGFMLWGSNEVSDQLTSLTGAQPLYGLGTFCAGNWLIATRTVELYTYASRQVGAKDPIAYRSGDRLLFSLRGYWTKEDEWALSHDIRGSNGFYIGNVIQPPSTDNNQYMVIQTSI